MDAELKAQALRGDWLAAPPLHPGLPHRAVSRRSAWKTLRSSAKCPQGTRGHPIGHGASTFGRTRNPALSLLRPPGARAEQHTLLLQTPAALTPAQGAPPSAPCPNLPGRLPQTRPASSHAGSPALSPSLQALLGTGPTALHPEPWPRPPPVQLPRAPISNTDPRCFPRSVCPPPPPLGDRICSVHSEILTDPRTVTPTSSASRTKRGTFQTLGGFAAGLPGAGLTSRSGVSEAPPGKRGLQLRLQMLPGPRLPRLEPCCPGHTPTGGAAFASLQEAATFHSSSWDCFQRKQSETPRWPVLLVLGRPWGPWSGPPGSPPSPGAGGSRTSLGVRAPGSALGVRLVPPPHSEGKAKSGRWRQCLGGRPWAPGKPNGMNSWARHLPPRALCSTWQPSQLPCQMVRGGELLARDGGHSIRQDTSQHLPECAQSRGASPRGSGHPRAAGLPEPTLPAPSPGLWASEQPQVFQAPPAPGPQNSAGMGFPHSDVRGDPRDSLTGQGPSC